MRRHAEIEDYSKMRVHSLRRLMDGVDMQVSALLIELHDSNNGNTHTDRQETVTD